MGSIERNNNQHTFKQPHTLMVQGTTSDAGKSILVTALCRILARHRIAVAPFKPQNMALNSAVTVEGGEIGRAQAVQAAACYLQPSVSMNPILLKPNSDLGAQVIINGKIKANMQAVEYHRYKPELLSKVISSHAQLQQQYRVVMVEGAGSPAEINLREHDIANMGFAEAIDCPVIIIADIDRGGVFAHLLGTYELLSTSEKARIKGFVINRFRGDVSLLDSGLKWLEKRTAVPVLGVIPYLHNLHIEAEDSINTQQEISQKTDSLRFVVLTYPRVSNHTDFDVLRLNPNIDCQFIRDPREFRGADLIILPGSKHVRADLNWLKQYGWDHIIKRHLRLGGKLIGICGGYQMLGNWIHDPDNIESAAGSDKGLGLLDMETTLHPNKILRNLSGKLLNTDIEVKGYEIHTGISKGKALENALFELKVLPDNNKILDGARSADNSIIGSYLHGMFDQPQILTYLLNWAGIKIVEEFDYNSFREQQINRLADSVEAAIPFKTLCNLLDIELEDNA